MALVGSRNYGIKPKVGGFTERAFAFSSAIDANRIAATHNNGDLILYETSIGFAVSKIPFANGLVLLSSPDGRIGAGADTKGNFTVYDFKTLRAFYNVGPHISDPRKSRPLKKCNDEIPFL